MSTDRAFRPKTLDKLKLKRLDLPNSLAELESMLEEEGIEFGAGSPFYEQVEKRLERIREDVRNTQNGQRERPEWYISRRNKFLGFRDQSAIGYAFVFGIVGALLSTVLLFASEVFSVFLGIQTFLQNEPAISLFLSISLITAYFFMEWNKAALVHRYGEEKRYKATLADTFKSLKYFFSLDINMPRDEIGMRQDLLSLSSKLNSMRWLIVALGIVGRLGDELIAIEGNWIKGFSTIVSDSTILQFLEYIGAGGLSIVLLGATHFVVNYFYGVYVRAVGSDEVDFFDSSSILQKEQEAKIQYYRFKLNQIWDKRSDQVTQIYLNQQKKQSLPRQVEETQAKPKAT